MDNGKEFETFISALLSYVSRFQKLNQFSYPYARNLAFSIFEIEPFPDSSNAKQVFKGDFSSLLLLTRSYFPRIDPSLIEERLKIYLAHFLPDFEDVEKIFWKLLKKEGAMTAFSFYRELHLWSGYNIYPPKCHDVLDSEGHLLAYTINEAKPEKKNQDIAKAKNDVAHYPFCPLCLENLGLLKPFRLNLRPLPFDDDWFFQLSPHPYMLNHGVLVSDEHRYLALEISDLSIAFKFLDLFPSFFIGLNADLPCVGGSILGHMHFQFAEGALPLFLAEKKELLKKDEINFYRPDFSPNTVLLVSSNISKIIAWIKKIKDCWYSYENQKLGIYNSLTFRNNALSLLFRKSEGQYYAYLIFRNAACNREFPEGIFHVRPSLLSFKKESIGLIEAGGFFIYPGRLKSELPLLFKANKERKSLSSLLKEHPGLSIYEGSYDLFSKFKDERELLTYVSSEILKDIRVFKLEEDFLSFLKKAIDE